MILIEDFLVLSIFARPTKNTTRSRAPAGPGPHTWDSKEGPLLAVAGGSRSTSYVPSPRAQQHGSSPNSKRAAAIDVQTSTASLFYSDLPSRARRPGRKLPRTVRLIACSTRASLARAAIPRFRTAQHKLGNPRGWPAVLAVGNNCLVTPAHHACLTISASGPTEMDCGPPRAFSRPGQTRPDP